MTWGGGRRGAVEGVCVCESKCTVQCVFSTTKCMINTMYTYMYMELMKLALTNNIHKLQQRLACFIQALLRHTIYVTIHEQIGHHVKKKTRKYAIFSAS